MGWETDPSLAAQPAYLRDFAQICQAADKVVFSRSLQAVSTARPRIVQEFDPRAVGQIKETAASNLTLGGPGLAAEALLAGLVDECNLFLAPVTLGCGTKALPAGLQWNLELLDERRFDNGMVQVHYRIKRCRDGDVTFVFRTEEAYAKNNLDFARRGTF